MLRHQHAVVLGASLAGLLVARVLSQRFERVTLIDRDALPNHAENRQGVPQGRHTHALLSRGTQILEAYFPGIVAGLLADGALTAEEGTSARIFQDGIRLAHCRTGRNGVFASRPLIEAHVRRRVLALPGLSVIERQNARALSLHGRRVTAVRIAPRTGDEPEREIHADLVVDATGRGSKTPAWLRAHGFEAAEEETVRVQVSYVTRLFRRRASDLGGDLGVIVAAAPPNRRAAAVLAQEGERWTVTMNCYLGECAPTELEGFVEFARGLPAPDVYELIRDAEPLGEATVASYPANLRHRYERLRRFPERYVVVGDAICSFNPIFGQGMSVAAVQATVLDTVLADGLERVGPRFFSRATKALDVPWNIVVGSDLRFPEVEGPRPLHVRLINAYMKRYVRAAARDSVLSRALHDVGNLLAPPESLMRPGLLSRVLFGKAPDPPLVAAVPGGG